MWIEPKGFTCLFFGLTIIAMILCVYKEKKLFQQQKIKKWSIIMTIFIWSSIRVLILLALGPQEVEVILTSRVYLLYGYVPNGMRNFEDGKSSRYFL